MTSTYITSSGKILGSILRQKMDEIATPEYIIDVNPYACINLVTNNAGDMNMKAWLATAAGIGEYIEGYMKTNMKTTGAYVYTEMATPPPPPPILPAMDTVSDLPTYGTAVAKDPYSILNLALPTMIFSQDQDIIKVQLDAIKENLNLISIWLNVEPVPFDQTSLQQDEDPMYALNGTGQILFTGALTIVDNVAQDIINAMKEYGNEITFIDANNIFATGIVHMLNGSRDSNELNNLVYSFDVGQVVPVATNKVAMIPGVYFGLSNGTVQFVNEYQSKVQSLVVAPPLVGATMTLEIPLLEIDLSQVVINFIDKFFEGMDRTDEEQKEMENNFGDVLRVTFNGLFTGGKVLFTELINKVNEFIAKIMVRLSIDNLVKKFTKRMCNFSAKLRAKFTEWMKKIGLVFDKIADRIREVLDLVFDILSLPPLIIAAVVDKITEQVTTFIQNFITKIAEKMALSVPLPAAAALAALADKMKKAIAVIKSVIDKIKLIIDKVVKFVTDLIEKMVELVKKIIKFIQKIVEWIETAKEKCQQCIEVFTALISAFGIYLAFAASDPNDSAPSPPPIPPDMVTAAQTYYLTSADVNETSASMTPQTNGNNITWSFVDSSATSGFVFVNNGALQPISATSAIGIYKLGIDLETSDFIKVIGTFETSGNPYIGVINNSQISDPIISNIFISSGIDSFPENTTALDYKIYKMTLYKYNESTSAMEKDISQIYHYGYFVKGLFSTINPLIDNMFTYCMGWIDISLLESEKIVMVNSKNYTEIIRMIRYNDTRTPIQVQ